jgi:hypothetical protein
MYTPAPATMDATCLIDALVQTVLSAAIKIARNERNLLIEMDDTLEELLSSSAPDTTQAPAEPPHGTSYKATNNTSTTTSGAATSRTGPVKGPNSPPRPAGRPRTGGTPRAPPLLPARTDTRPAGGGAVQVTLHLVGEPAGKRHRPIRAQPLIPGKSQARPRDKHGLKAHRQERPTRLRSPQRRTHPGSPDVRPGPGGPSKTHLHAAIRDSPTTPVRTSAFATALHGRGRVQWRT